MVVIAASYVMAARLVGEAKQELYILRTLGVKKNATFNLIVVHTITIAFVGSIIGLTLGIVGTQVAATGVRWVWVMLFSRRFCSLRKRCRLWC